MERVGRQDHFFELGGHSLFAVQLISRLREALKVEVSLGDVFERPVLSEFAKAVAGAGKAKQPQIGRVSREGPLELSFAQQRLWFLAQLEGASAAYHIAGGVRLRGRLDREALKRALDRIVARHEALRTTFEEVNGEPRQRIGAQECGFALLEQDLRGHEDREGEEEGIAQQEAQGEFDLEKGPLIRGRLLRLADEEHILLVTMHHIVSDGWSLAVLMEEMSELYGAYSRGEEDPLEPLAVQYADYALWQRNWLQGEVLEEQAQYWRGALKGAPAVLELPADHAQAGAAGLCGSAGWGGIG